MKQIPSSLNFVLALKRQQIILSKALLERYICLITEVIVTVIIVVISQIMLMFYPKQDATLTLLFNKEYLLSLTELVMHQQKQLKHIT